MTKLHMRTGACKLRGELTWAIEDFSERQAAAAPGQRMYSQKITIPNPEAGEEEQKSYSFQIFVNLAGTEDKRDHIHLYLVRCDQSREDVMVAASFFLVDDLGNRISEHTPCKFTKLFGKEPSWGYETFYPLSKLKSKEANVIVFNTLTIGCEIVVMLDRDDVKEGPSEIKEAPKLGDQLFPRMKKGIMTDLTLVCDGKRLPCNKVVLAARSSVFHDMFENSELDQEEGLVIKDMKPKVLEKVLEFVYLDKVDIGDHAEDLFKAGDKYNISGLKQLCEMALVQALTASNAAETLILLDLHGCETAHAEAAYRFAARHLAEVKQTEAWARVVAAHPTVVHGVFNAVAPTQ